MKMEAPGQCNIFFGCKREIIGRVIPSFPTNENGSRSDLGPLATLLQEPILPGGMISATKRPLDCVPWKESWFFELWDMQKGRSCRDSQSTELGLSIENLNKISSSYERDLGCSIAWSTP